MTIRHALAIAVFALANVAGAEAAYKSPWDGIWEGMLNKTEPVSVTIAGGKVVGYTIRGFTPLPIQSASISRSSVSLVIGADYHVRLTKEGDRAAIGVAHGPLGDGTASLIRQ
jgi:hypothetical protein